MLSFLRESPRIKLFLAIVALSYGAIMVSMIPLMADSSRGEFPHLLQARAILGGHFGLSDDVADLNYGFVWCRGHVQQVWGLGVGLWLVPFEILHQLSGDLLPPEKSGLCFAFSLLAFYSLQTGRAIARLSNLATGIIFVWITLASPPLWTLCRAARSVFEETAVYALLASLGLLTAFVRTTVTGSVRDYYLGCGLAALVPFLRPTHAIYGALTIAISAFLLRRSGKSLIRLGVGIGAVAAAWCFLGMSNDIRFGKPWEFGHGLTSTSSEMVYLTRFGNPYSSAGAIEAGKELITILFGANDIVDKEAFSEDVVSNQVPLPRWRRLDFSVFSPVWPFVCMAGTFAVLLRVSVLGKHGNDIEVQWIRLRTGFAALTLWGYISVFGLGVFYLKFPVISSRYLVDFAPGVLALAFVTVSSFSVVFPRCAGLVFLAWWLVETRNSKGPPQISQMPSATLSRFDAVSKKKPSFPGAYSSPIQARNTGIVGDGDGWNIEDERTRQIVTLIIDSPEFVEVQIDQTAEGGSERINNAGCRAMIEGEELFLLESTVVDGQLTKVFTVPKRFRENSVSVVLFICFDVRFHNDREWLSHRLSKVRWR